MVFGRTYPNALTSTVARPVALPMVLPSDRLAFAAAVLTCNAVGRAPRIVRIQDTLHLEHIWVSEGLLDDVRDDRSLEVLEPASEVPFDQNGDLLDRSGAPSREALAATH
jgi:hypothetical protein